MAFWSRIFHLMEQVEISEQKWKCELLNSEYDAMNTVFANKNANEHICWALMPKIGIYLNEKTFQNKFRSTNYS